MSADSIYFIKMSVDEVWNVICFTISGGMLGLANFDGIYYKMENVSMEPQPVQKPHPAILIGSCGFRGRS